ncbi:MAG: DegT/DnrJ/EryC1/StrS family aminotransferase [Bacteroidetes bacterium]|nr:DegT/DnrJ/EryC1/StrS family aminotransferase [Bacteroidota bacterium]MDA0903919.1 DegT/DnrJ/EryC1/StrS family aminotransferase [Bacteroidota bacterium]MDA1242765.1 DegT/DnrJ/EryC1/StrS family aminotransferase [Bacteroidota bacterium]
MSSLRDARSEQHNSPEQRDSPEVMHMVDLQGLHARMAKELRGAMQEVVDTSAFIQGKHVRDFEGALAQRLGDDCHVVGCGNGTDALLLALRAMGIGPGDEVIVPDFTFIATAEVVALTGATPVFADIDPRTFQLDVTSAQRAMSDQTRAVIVVHLFGQCADMDALGAWAQTHGLHVVEDNAQSLGASWFGTRVQGRAGLLGDAGTTSFFPSKNLGALGDGGAVLTRNASLAEKVRLLANHGAKQKYHHLEIGLNSRLDGLQAAFLGAKLPHFDDMIARRQKAASWYDVALGAGPGAWAGGAGDFGVVVPFREERSTHMFHQYCVLLPRETNREAVQRELQSRGIPTAVYYPTPLSSQPAFQGKGRTVEGGTPAAHEVSRRILALPMHTELTPDMVQRVVEELFRTLPTPQD